MQVGHRDFRRGDQPEAISLGHVGLLGELRQLPRARHGFRSNQVGDPKLLVTMPGRVDVQHVVDASTEKVKELTNFIYGSGERDEVAEARRALYKQVSYDLSSMRPEQASRAFASGEGLPDEWNPYEDGYKPDGISFVGDDPEIAEEDEESIP